MRDKEYKPYSFRLSEKTNDNLKKLAKEHNVSLNILFALLINLEKKYGLPKMQNKNGNKKTPGAY
jgi:hypothetical protein